ncbi:MAG: ATP-binding cassette domain-containing protein [Flavobacteriales bacterium]
MKLEADGIQLSYGQHLVLSDIYLRLASGEVRGLLGRNGSGKSSLLKVIFGSLKVHASSIRIDGKATRGISDRIKFLPQDHCFPGFLKLRSAFKIFQVIESDFEPWVVHFDNNLDQRIGQLSTGQRRLFETLTILNSDSDFALLDEPFSGLSPLLIEQLKNEISKVKGRKGILISDHQYEDVMDLCASVYLLREGKLHLLQERNDLIELAYLK